MSTTRRTLLLACAALAGCGREAPPAPPPAVSSDRVALARLINVPNGVTSACWQTGPLAAHGGDWWLAAILDMPADRVPQLLQDPPTPGEIDTPPGMASDAVFATLRSLSGASSLPDGRLRLPGPLHGVAPFARSPLLHGDALQMSPTRVLVALWTS